MGYGIGEAVTVFIEGHKHFVTRKRRGWWEEWQTVLALYRQTGEWVDPNHPTHGKWARLTYNWLSQRRIDEDIKAELKRKGFPLTPPPPKPRGIQGNANLPLEDPVFNLACNTLQKGETLAYSVASELRSRYTSGKLPKDKATRLSELGFIF